MPDTDDTAAPVRTPDAGGEVTAQDIRDLLYALGAGRSEDVAEWVNERIRQAREQAWREATDEMNRYR